MPIDFAAHARSLGAKAYTATTVEELKEALKQAKEETVTTLIEIPVVPGTNTDGYESWWRVGVPEVSESEQVLEAHEEMKKTSKQAKTINEEVASMSKNYRLS